MSYQIVQQPSGKFAIWSTVVDSFILADATEADVLDYFLQLETQRVTDMVNGIINALKKGMKPYYQFTRTWEELLVLHEKVYGYKFVPLENQPN